MNRLRSRPWLAAGGGIALLALVILLPGIRNGFAYDDAQVIAGDPALHSLSTALPRAFAPYLNGQMLRPLPMIGFALQWVVGEGSPLVFRMVSMVLYAVVCVQVLLLCRRAGTAWGPGLLGALAFAVHPTHAEVTANGVGQAELWAALTVLAASCWYLRVRTTRAWRARDSLLLAVWTMVAAHAKEVGYVLPGLVLAVEVLAVPDRGAWAARLRTLREAALTVVAATLASLWIRDSILGELGGGVPHDSLAGMGLGARAVAVLGLVPQWVRLLLWPAHLQTEYGPPALDASTQFGAAHLLGATLVIASVTAFALAWRRWPLIALGMAWIGIALAPVANLVVPTPILLAERSFFLPSVGLALVVGGTAEALLPWLARHRQLRTAAIGAAGLILLAAAWRSAVQQPLWRDTLTIMRATVQEAPRSYRAFFLLGRALVSAGDLQGAEVAFRESISLWQRDPQPFEDLGQLLRTQGRCEEAIPILQQGVLADSTGAVVRSRLVECLLVEQRWDEAEREMQRGLAQGVTAYRTGLDRLRALRDGQPPA